MEDLASNLLATLKKPSASTETKLSLFTQLKSLIKHQQVLEPAQPIIFECIYLALNSSTSASLVTTGFSALTHLGKRLSQQEQLEAVFSQRCDIMGVLLERLGDAKESHRVAAGQAFCDLWPARQADVEKLIKESAIEGIHIRAKEAGMQWVTKMHVEHNLQFRGFVGSIVECLEDADGGVRETAKTNIVELFKNAPHRAKADLKKQLVVHNVRKSIAAYILERLQIPATEINLANSTHSASTAATPQHQISTADIAMSESILPPSANGEHIDPLDVYTQRELEDMFRDMHTCFEGKENEQNWMPRDNNVLKLRRLLKGNGPTEYPAVFVAGIKSELDGILKVANTLRTTMSSNGCHLVQELAKTLGSALDPMCEILLQSFVKMCANTKNISAQNGNNTVDVLYSNITCNARILQHIWVACQDKNVQPRTFAPGWLKTILKRQMQNKAHFEHSGGLDLTDKCIKKGLADANPKVREGMRGAYWLFAQAWPERGEAIMTTLDPKSKQLLERDAANPNPTTAAFTSSVGPGPTSNPRAVISTTSSTLKETIKAQKQAALAGKRLPERPVSAMSTFSPVRQVTKSTARTPSNLSATATHNGVPSTGSSHPTARPACSTGQEKNSLMSAPLRRPRRLDAPRPATADVYASRKLMRAETPPPLPGSPGNSPGGPVSKTSNSTNAGNQTKAFPTTSLLPKAANSGQSLSSGSPKTSPVQARPNTSHTANTGSVDFSLATLDGGIISPTFREENLTMVIPEGKLSYRAPFAQSIMKTESNRPGDGHSSLPSMAEEDNFTMIIPQKAALLEARVLSATHTGIPTSRLPSAPRSRQGEDHQGYVIVVNSANDPEGFPVVTPVKSERRADNTMMVYEDPDADHIVVSMPEELGKVVLEELPLNEHIPAAYPNSHVVMLQEPMGNTEERPVSPSKKSIDRSTEIPLLDRAEVLKTRRLLASGIERIRTRTLDAHGFRRLQELIKNSTHGSSVNFTDLLLVLLDYLQAPDDTFKVTTFKAQSLKTQVLATIRAVLVLHRRDESIRAAYACTMCAVVSAKRMYDNSSHLAVDLDKTANEIIRLAGEQTHVCLDQMMSLVASDYDLDEVGHRRVITMALGVLTKLLVAVSAGEVNLGAAQKQRLGRMAVGILDDVDPDVRRAGTGFCIELYGAFGEDGKGEFWNALRGAGEAQLNLVAYYLARNGRA